jgi:hypothetical protein
MLRMLGKPENSGKSLLESREEAYGRTQLLERLRIGVVPLERS